jgi:hypothetical protein
MADDVVAQFVATYYKLLYSSGDSIPKFYDARAEVTRSSQGVATIVSLSDAPGLLPFDPTTTVTKINDCESQTLLEGLLITIYGTLSDCPFTQRFALSQQHSRWFITSDAFFLYDGSSDELVGTERAPLEQPAVAVSGLPPPPKKVVSSFEPAAQPLGFRAKKPKLDEFDAKRSVTILNLSNNYNGDEVAAHFEAFGQVTYRFYTHNVIYLEFAREEMCDDAVAADPLVYQGATTDVRKGIVIKEQKNVGRYNRFSYGRK